MTPGARVAAAVEILDRVLGGEPAEKVARITTANTRALSRLPEAG